MEWRKLTPMECDDCVVHLYTQYGIFDFCLEREHDEYKKPISNSQRYKMLGNGWTTAVIEHIFKGVEA